MLVRTNVVRPRSNVSKIKSRPVPWLVLIRTIDGLTLPTKSVNIGVEVGAGIGIGIAAGMGVKVGVGVGEGVAVGIGIACLDIRLQVGGQCWSSIG